MRGQSGGQKELCARPGHLKPTFTGVCVCVCETGEVLSPNARSAVVQAGQATCARSYCPTMPPFSSPKDKEQLRCGAQLILTEPGQEAVLFSPLFISYQKCYTQQCYLFMRISSVFPPLTVTKFKMGVILCVSTHIIICEIKYGVTTFPKTPFYLQVESVVL